MLTRAALVAVALLASGCAHTDKPYPETWSRPFVPHACVLDNLSFEDLPSDYTSAIPVRLSDIFFEGRLSGTPVSSVRFVALDERKFEVSPWMDGAALEDRGILRVRKRECRGNQFSFRTNWDGDAYAAAAGLLWTGGAILPFLARSEFVFSRNENGQLIVHAKRQNGGALFFLVPFKTTWHDEWLFYEQVDEREVLSKENGSSPEP